MGFFKRSRQLLSWREPIFFSARTRDRRGWMLRGLLALVIFSAMMFGFYAQKHWGKKGPKFSVAGGVLLSAFIGVFLTATLEAPDMNREATIYDDQITSFGNAGTHMSMSTWPLRDVAFVQLIPPEEFGKPFGAMVIQTRRGQGRVGVPRHLPMRRIADVLHRQGVSVILNGWQPPEPEPKVEPHAPPPPPDVMPMTSARVERLDEGEAGQIISPFNYRLGMTMALGPFLVSLIVGLAGCAYAIYWIAFVKGPAPLHPAIAGFGGLGLIVFGLWFTGRFGNLAPSLYLLRVAKSVIEMRPGAVLNPRDPDVIYIDVIPRANWGKAMLKSFSDTGLLKVDELSRTILFEGDLERWRIPAASLISAEVESYRAAGSVEGQQQVETFYVAVIRANVGGSVWEAPVSKCHVEFRPKDNRLREENAIALRDRIRAIMPSGPGAARPAQPGVVS